ncbi:MAG: aminotransferase class IV, partial [Candidatus Hydrogenedentales bacterium]
YRLGKLGIAPSPVDMDDVFLYHKTTRRATYDEARAACPDCDEVLLWNARREMTEATVSNLVVERDGRLVTPPVSSGLLPGTLRAKLLAEGRIEEAVVLLDDLPHVTRLWLINGVRGWVQAPLSALPCIHAETK